MNSERSGDGEAMSALESVLEPAYRIEHEHLSDVELLFEFESR